MRFMQWLDAQHTTLVVVLQPTATTEDIMHLISESARLIREVPHAVDVIWELPEVRVHEPHLLRLFQHCMIVHPPNLRRVVVVARQHNRLIEGTLEVASKIAGPRLKLVSGENTFIVKTRDEAIALLGLDQAYT